MARIVKLDEKFYVAGQILPDEIAELARTGIKTIVNNRPDGEDPATQPYGLEIEAAALEHGIEVVNIPFTAQTLTSAEVAEFIDVLERRGGEPMLAFCRSGNRSSMIWAAAKIGLGASVDEIVEKAGRAGYDLRAAASFLHNLGKMAALK
jgi:uncharacterized protein (TIGR01244 family)